MRTLRIWCIRTLEMTKLLLKHNVITNRNPYILYHAVELNNISMAEFLLDNGFTTDYNIMFDIQARGNLRMLMLLISRGIILNIDDGYIRHLRRQKHNKFADWLAVRGPYTDEIFDRDDKLKLEQDALDERKRKEEIRQLIESKAPIEVNKEYTYLYVDCYLEKDDTNMFEVFKDRDLLRAILSRAVTEKSYECVKKALHLIDSQDIRDFTDIVLLGNLDIMRILIGKGHIYSVVSTLLDHNKWRTLIRLSDLIQLSQQSISRILQAASHYKKVVVYRHFIKYFKGTQIFDGGIFADIIKKHGMATNSD
jgi:hypothetical protein